MIAAVCLLGYAFLLLTIAASQLVRAGWTDRAPRLAIAAWLALTSSAIGSVILGGLALVVPTAGVSSHLADLLAACEHDVRARYGHPGGAALAAAGVALTFVVAARVGWCTVRMLVTARRDGQRHCQQLQAVGRADRRLGAVVVDYGEPAAYCLPGARQPIVLTTAAIEALDDVQLTAVLAHERAHQRGHHHLVVLVAGSLAAAFPFVPAFRHGHERVTHLVELRADDEAAKATSRLKAAEALLALGAPALAAPDPPAGRGRIRYRSPHQASPPHIRTARPPPCDGRHGRPRRGGRLSVRGAQRSGPDPHRRALHRHGLFGNPFGG